MPDQYKLPALSAAAAAGMVLAARWAVLRHDRGHGASTARPPWRRTARDARPPADDAVPPRNDGACAAVREAERLVHGYRQQAQARTDPTR